MYLRASAYNRRACWQRNNKFETCEYDPLIRNGPMLLCVCAAITGLSFITRDSPTALSRRNMTIGRENVVLQKFMNPAGNVFETIVVEELARLSAVGASSDDATWFPDFSWRPLVHTSCNLFVGWRFDQTVHRSEYHLENRNIRFDLLLWDLIRQCPMVISERSVDVEGPPVMLINATSWPRARGYR